MLATNLASVSLWLGADFWKFVKVRRKRNRNEEDPPIPFWQKLLKWSRNRFIPERQMDDNFRLLPKFFHREAPRYRYFPWLLDVESDPSIKRRQSNQLDDSCSSSLLEESQLTSEAITLQQPLTLHESYCAQLSQMKRERFSNPETAQPVRDLQLSPDGKWLVVAWTIGASVYKYKPEVRF